MPDKVKLTKAQRLARPIINFLVERYFPNGLFFYGRGPLHAFDRMGEERGMAIGGMAALSLARTAAEQGASVLSVNIEGVTVNDADLGDWRITVERSALNTPPAGGDNG